MQIVVSDVVVTVQRKKIKNMNLYVKPPLGTVSVTAPLSLSDERIVLFVQSKMEWIRKQQETLRNQPPKAERSFASGEILPVFGVPYRLDVEHGYGKNGLILKGDRAILTVGEDFTLKQREDVVKQWYRGLLREEIERYLPKWETITGLYCNCWQVRDMKTRWGTCNTGTKKIWINLRLAEKPVACLEYVILHELAHLKVRNHDKRFWGILDEYMKDWPKVRKRLNESS